jgi:hypothetical protein
MKLINWAPLAAGARRRVAAGAAVAVIGASTAFGGGLGAAHAADAPAPTGIILGVGASESQRVVSWYSAAGTAQVVQVAATNDLSKGKFPARPPSPRTR